MDNLFLDGFVNVDNNFIYFIIWIFILDFHLHLFPQTGMFRFTFLYTYLLSQNNLFQIILFGNVFVKFVHNNVKLLWSPRYLGVFSYSFAGQAI